MIQLMKKLLWDELYFVQVARSTLLFLGLLVHNGVLLPSAGKGGWYGGLAMAALGVYLRAGDKPNGKPSPSVP